MQESVSLPSPFISRDPLLSRNWSPLITGLAACRPPGAAAWPLGYKKVRVSTKTHGGKRSFEEDVKVETVSGKHEREERSQHGEISLWVV
ncbi:unnamed protein product [Pleuronectes platessa]|uniref:Uncharacterized protein n=1 Tax=Pleuronectes platessa TaxID=8262 RepID=A0A9N7U6M7_PLEPL|nr:unnamed protein product [Pleuronectes platessa]